MDCSKLPRQLLFKDRRNIEDFTRDNSINESILNSMLEIDFLQTPDFKDRALKYLNTAYYICIMLMYEEYPKLSLLKCYDIACCGNSDDEESQATTLSLVLLFLRWIYENPTPKFREIINIIDNFLKKKYICYNEPFAENICYYSIYQMLCENITPEMVLIPNEFVLRKIDKQAIDDIQSSKFTWTQLTDYYNYEVMLDITMTVGKNEDERELICESMDHDARMFYGETSAPYKDGAKNKIDALRHAIYKKHHQEAEDKLYQDMMDAQSEQLYSCDSKEVEKLKARIADLEAQLEEVRNKDKGISLGLNQDQAALFGLSLANAFEFNYTNKKKDLAPMLHGIFGWGEFRLKQGLSNPYKKAEKEKLANLFKDLCPHLYDVIMNKGERLP